MQVKEIQEFLKLTADGKAGVGTLNAIKGYFKRAYPKLKVDAWPKNRLLLAMEQAIYASNKMEVGTIDGFIGEQTRYMRMLWQAKLAGDDEVKEESTWRDKLIVSKNDWPLQSQVSNYFGKVGENQTSLILPFPMVLAWDKSTTLTKFSCNKKVKKSMEKVFQNTFDHYGHEKIKTLGLDLFGGCLNVRKMRGGSAWSMHSFGIAIDIDPDRNSLKTPWKKAQMSKPEYTKFVEFFYSEGAINLGKERDFDAMHFQFARI
jgi:hypothetical protein